MAQPRLFAIQPFSLPLLFGFMHSPSKLIIYQLDSLSRILREIFLNLPAARPGFPSQAESVFDNLRIRIRNPESQTDPFRLVGEDPGLRVRAQAGAVHHAA
jgi:hypothetical protein